MVNLPFRMVNAYFPFTIFYHTFFYHSNGEFTIFLYHSPILGAAHWVTFLRDPSGPSRRWIRGRRPRIIFSVAFDQRSMSVLRRGWGRCKVCLPSYDSSSIFGEGDREQKYELEREGKAWSEGRVFHFSIRSLCDPHLHLYYIYIYWI